MNDRQGNVCVWGGCFAIILGLVVVMGCEEAETQRSLVLTPSQSTLLDAGDQVVLTASLPEDATSTTVASNEVARGAQILYPLEWTVTTPAGHVIPSGGDSAVYFSDAYNAPNAVIVRDQAGREGIAAIN